LVEEINIYIYLVFNNIIPMSFLLVKVSEGQNKGGLKTQAAPCEPTELGVNPFNAEFRIGF
jgi:hypothetical protein